MLKNSRQDYGVEYRDFEIQNDSQREQALRNVLRKRGMNPIVAIGFSQANAVEKVAAEFPDTQFAIVDMVVDLPNVRSILFKEHEGSYIVGLLAAMASETGKVGFVGGMDIPLISKFACGYKQGVAAANPDAEVFENMTGTTGAAWNDRSRAVSWPSLSSTVVRMLFITQLAAPELVFFRQQLTPASLASVSTATRTAASGSVLTSMLKRVDIAVYQAFEDAENDSWSSGFEVLGLKEGGVDWALDDNNAELVNDEMKAAVEQASQQIISGEIVVHDYMSDESCPN